MPGIPDTSVPVPQAPEVAHEVRLVRVNFARRYGQSRLVNAGADSIVEFGAPEQGFVWLVERVAIECSAAPTSVELYAGNPGVAGPAPSAFVDSLGVVAGQSRGYTPPIHVPQNSSVYLFLAGFAADVYASLQLVVCRVEKMTQENHASEMLREMRQLRHAFTGEN